MLDRQYHYFAAQHPNPSTGLDRRWEAHWTHRIVEHHRFFSAGVQYCMGDINTEHDVRKVSRSGENRL